MAYKDKEKKREYQKEYYKKPESKAKRREYIKKNYIKVSLALKKNSLKRIFNLTIDDYNKILKKQGGVCAICRNKENGKVLSVDHNHITGKVRGLLCMNCNTILGKLKEDISILKKVIKYLQG